MIKLGWVWVPVLYASIGDRQPDYRKCYSVCLKASGTGFIIWDFSSAFGTIKNLLKCPTYKKSRKKECFHPDIPFYSSPLSPLPCQLECKYSCILKSTNLRKEKNLPIVKYHGKWPFTRLEWFFISLKSEFNQISKFLVTFGSENSCQKWWTVSSLGVTSFFHSFSRLETQSASSSE